MDIKEYQAFIKNLCVWSRVNYTIPVFTLSGDEMDQIRRHPDHCQRQMTSCDANPDGGEGLDGGARPKFVIF